MRIVSVQETQGGDVHLCLYGNKGSSREVQTHHRPHSAEFILVMGHMQPMEGSDWPKSSIFTEEKKKNFFNCQKHFHFKLFK